MIVVDIAFSIARSRPVLGQFIDWSEKIELKNKKNLAVEKKIEMLLNAQKFDQ